MILYPCNHFNLDLGCHSCCIKYLTEQRGYRPLYGHVGIVTFGNGQRLSYVDEASGNVVMGHQFLVGPCIPYSCVDQRYETVPAPVEVIAVTSLVDRNQVANCCFTYADATRLECYRSMCNLPSLQGDCCWHPDYIAPVRINQMRMQINKESVIKI